MTTLILRFGGVEDKGADILAKAPTLARLRALDLYASGLSSDGLRAITSSPHLAGLTDLVVGCNEEIGDQGATVLAGSHALSRRTE